MQDLEIWNQTAGCKLYILSRNSWWIEFLISNSHTWNYLTMGKHENMFLPCGLSNQFGNCRLPRTRKCEALLMNWTIPQPISVYVNNCIRKKSLPLRWEDDSVRVRYPLYVKSPGFRFQLEASWISSHNEELWYNETICQWMTICIYKINLNRESKVLWFFSRGRTRLAFSFFLTHNFFLFPLRDTFISCSWQGFFFFVFFWSREYW